MKKIVGFTLVLTLLVTVSLSAAVDTARQMSCMRLMHSARLRHCWRDS